MCVLFVEDEPLILMATAFCLEGAGFKVMTADDGLHAIDLLEQHPGHFTALVTDLHMPRLTGAHVVMSMRRTYPGIPMIITTALTHVVTEGWQLQYAVDMLAKAWFRTRPFWVTQGARKLPACEGRVSVGRVSCVGGG